MSITPEQQKQKEEAELQRKLADLKARYEAGEITKAEYDKQVKALKKGKGGMGTLILIVGAGLGLGAVIWYEFLRKKPSTTTTTPKIQWPTDYTQPTQIPYNPYSGGGGGTLPTPPPGGGSPSGGGGGGGGSPTQQQPMTQQQPTTPIGMSNQQYQQNQATLQSSYQQAVVQRGIMNTQLQQQYTPNAIAQGTIQPFQNPYYGASQILSPNPVRTATMYQGAYVYQNPTPQQRALTPTYTPPPPVTYVPAGSTPPPPSRGPPVQYFT